MKRPQTRYFSLIELLVVIAVIMILAGLLFPALRSSRESAKKAQCLANQKNIGVYVYQYAYNNNQSLKVLSNWKTWLATRRKQQKRRTIKQRLRWVPNTLTLCNSWCGFAAEIFRLAGKEQKIVPCTTEEFPRPAPRPKNSRLEKMMLRLAGLPPMPHWKDALKEFCDLEFGKGNS